MVALGGVRVSLSPASPYLVKGQARPATQQSAPISAIYRPHSRNALTSVGLSALARIGRSDVSPRLMAECVALHGRAF